MEKTTTLRKEIVKELRKKRDKVEVVLKILFVNNQTGTHDDDEKEGYFSSGNNVMNRLTDILVDT